MTVSGAATGNGMFGLSDFEDFDWWSAGTSFNFSQNLVGQPAGDAPFNPWGTPDGNSGDFTFFNASGSPMAPDAPYYFYRSDTDGGSGDSLLLSSLQEVQAGVPEPSAVWLAGIGVAALAGLKLYRRA